MKNTDNKCIRQVFLKKQEFENSSREVLAIKSLYRIISAVLSQLRVTAQHVQRTKTKELINDLSITKTDSGHLILMSILFKTICTNRHTR